MQLAKSQQARINRFLKVAAALIGGALSLPLQAAELSLIEGVFKRDTNKGGLASTHLSLGGRYSQPLRGPMHWFAEGALGIKTYSTESGYEPKNAVNMRVGGGVRYYFDRFNERVSPYGAFGASLASERKASQNGGGIVETEADGLYYGAAVGLRFSLTPAFFMDVETPLFTSALFATEEEKVTSTSGAGVTTTTRSESSRYEVFASTRGALSSMTVAIGMHF